MSVMQISCVFWGFFLCVFCANMSGSQKSNSSGRILETNVEGSRRTLGRRAESDARLRPLWSDSDTCPGRPLVQRCCCEFNCWQSIATFSTVRLQNVAQGENIESQHIGFWWCAGFVCGNSWKYGFSVGGCSVQTTGRISCFNYCYLGFIYWLHSCGNTRPVML